MSTLVPISHPRFRFVERAVFVRRVVGDCMAHACALRKDGDRVKLDACCQYGVDVDVAERDAILGHADQLRSILQPSAREVPWFHDHEEVDADFPSGRHVRTRTHGDGCVFLAHDGRGCAIHRASLEGGWDFHGIKPNVCRLYPMTYAGDRLVLSDDYADYSCADASGAATVYQVARADLGALFGAELVEALDEVERRVLREAGRARPDGLRVVDQGA